MTDIADRSPATRPSHDADRIRALALQSGLNDLDRVGLDDWSDQRLLAAAAEVLARPKVAPADSFVLHAPLELLARAGLLRHLRPGDRRRARARVVQLAVQYAAAGDELDEPVDRSGPELAPDAATRTAQDLIDAIAAGDLTGADRAATALGDGTTPIEQRHLLAAAVAPALAAAGHASILLTLRPQVAGPHDLSGRLLRGPTRELARHPDQQLTWFTGDHPGPGGAPRAPGGAAPGRTPGRTPGRAPTDGLGGIAEIAALDPGGHSGHDPGAEQLGRALLDVPVLGVPGSSFIYPLMHQVDENGLAADLLDPVLTPGVTVAGARRALGRIAAWSMLQEPDEHAPYGWTHCLTLPQALLALAGPGLDAHRAITIAATHVVGFRAALGSRRLDPTWEPEPPGTATLLEAIEAGPDVAAAVAWHTPPAAHAELMATLAARAALHHDAHLVKYTLACFDAAAADPDARHLHLAAAASLSAFWAQLPDPA